MEDKNRKKKRLKISLIYFAVILVIGSVIYFIVQPRPSCKDGIRNQNEQGIDCGGPCFTCIEEKIPVNLDVLNVEVVHDIDNKYDVAIRVKNQNEIFGASGIKFKVIFENENGEEIASRDEYKDYFILPKEEKYLIVQGIPIENRPTQVRVEVQDVSWEEFAQYEEPRLIILDANYKEKPEDGGFSKVTGILVNKSGVDFETIKINVIIQDENGKLLATNYQIVNTIRANEQRNFIMFFSHEFPGSVANTKIEPETNVFDSDNYIKIHGSVERWEPDEK